MHTPKPYDEDRLKRMNATASSLNEASRKLAIAATHLHNDFQDLRNAGNYTSYIIIGTGVVEFVLENLLRAYVHSLNAGIILAEVSTEDTRTEEFTFKAPKTSGQILRTLKENFSFEAHQPETYGKLKRLIDTRNMLAHELIDKYDGNLKSANESLKPYSDLKPVEECIYAVRDRINEINVSVSLRQKAWFERP